MTALSPPAYGNSLFNGIRKGLEEALAYEKGKASAETIARKRSLPDVDVKAERESLDMTQKAFVNVLGVSRRTVESWETGRSTVGDGTKTPTEDDTINQI